MQRPPRRWRIGLGTAALVLVVPLVTAAASSSPSPVTPGSAAERRADLLGARGLGHRDRDDRGIGPARVERH